MKVTYNNNKYYSSLSIKINFMLLGRENFSLKSMKIRYEKATKGKKRKKNEQRKNSDMSQLLSWRITAIVNDNI